MHRNCFIILLSFAFSLTSFAYDFVSGGIYYKYYQPNEVAVTMNTTNNTYSGDLVIPDHVYNGATRYEVTAIDSYGLANCSNLNSVILPGSVVNYYAYSLSNTAIKSIVIPANTDIGMGNVFNGCSSLVTASFLPGCTYFGFVYFKNCTSLRSVYLPSTIVFGGANQFNGCTSLDSVFVNLMTPPSIGPSVFYGVSTSTCKLFVPVGSKAAYQAAANWSSFTHIIETNMDSPQLTGSGNLSTTSGWTGGTRNRFSNISVNNGELTVDLDAKLEKVEVSANSKITVSTGMNLNAYNLTLNSNSADGTATFVNHGTANLTTGDVKQFLKGGRTYYITSPINNATSDVVKRISGALLGYYDETSNTFTNITNNTTNLVPGKGYLVKLTADATLNFSGTMNDGSIIIPLTNTSANTSFHGYNLVGNPFPSYLDWHAVSRANADVSMWTRTKGTGNSYQFDTYNSTSGVGTNNSGYGALTRYIPPMQGFWVKTPDASASGSLTLDNSMRYHKDVNSNLMKVGSMTKTRELIRLKINRDIYSDEAILLMDAQAQNEADEFDSEKMINNNPEIPEIASVIDGKKMVINGISNAPQTLQFPLSFKTGTAGNFQLNAVEMSIPDACEIQLTDRIEKKTIQIDSSFKYDFQSEITDTDQRFVITVKVPGTITDITDDVNQIKPFITNPEPGTLCIENKTSSNMQYQLSDLAGQILREGANTGNAFYLNNLPTKQFYILRIQDHNQVTVNKVWID